MSDTAQAHNVDSTVSAAGEPQLQVTPVPPQVGVIAEALGEIAADLHRLAATDAASPAGYFVQSAATNMRSISEALASGEFPDQAAAHVMSAAAWCGTFVGSVGAMSSATASGQDLAPSGQSGAGTDIATSTRGRSDSDETTGIPQTVDVRNDSAAEVTVDKPEGQDQQTGGSATAGTNIAAAGAAAAVAGAFVGHDKLADLTHADDVLGSEFDPGQTTPTFGAAESLDLGATAPEASESGNFGTDSIQVPSEVEVDSAATAGGSVPSDLAPADRSVDPEPDAADDAPMTDTPAVSSTTDDQPLSEATPDSADRLAAVTNSHTLVHAPIADDESGLVIDEADEADATELRAYEAAFGPVTESGAADDSGAQAGALAATLGRDPVAAAEDVLPSAQTEGSQTRLGAAASVAFAPDASSSEAAHGAASVSAGTSLPASGADQEVPASGADQEVPASGADQEVPASGADQEIPASGADQEIPASGADQEIPGSAESVAGMQVPQGQTTFPGDQAAEVVYTEDDSWLQDTVDIQAMAKKAPADVNLAQAIAATADLTSGSQEVPLAAPSGEPIARSFALPPQPAQAEDSYDQDQDTTEPGASAYRMTAGSTSAAGDCVPSGSHANSGHATPPDAVLTDGPTVAMSAEAVGPAPYDESRTTHVLQNPESTEAFGDLNSTRIMTPPEASSVDFNHVDGEQSQPVAGLGQDTVPMTSTTRQQLSEQHLVDQQWQDRPTEVVGQEQLAATRRMQDGPFAETVQSAVPESTWMNSDTIDHKSYQAQVAARPLGDNAPTVAIPTNFAGGSAAVEDDGYEEDRQTTVTPPAVVEQLKRARQAAEAEGAKRRGNLPWGGAPGK